MATKLWIGCVGGTPQALIASLENHMPQRAVFVVSRETMKFPEQHLLPHLKRATSIQEGSCDQVLVTQVDDFEDCVQTLQAELTGLVRSWMRHPQPEIIVDVTAGTKCMSAALAFVARPWICSFSYVGGKRDKGGVGTVQTGTEQVTITRNPWRSLANCIIEPAVHLFENGYPEAAARLANPSQAEATPDMKRALSAFQQMAQAYAEWDRFAHTTAHNLLRDTKARSAELRLLFPGQAATLILNTVTRHMEWLADIPSEGLDRRLMLDLIGNADRTANRSRWDDAVARLYRATELASQIEIRDAGALDAASGQVLWDKVPPQLQSKWQDRAHNGLLRLGLQDQYLLLAELGNPLGARFRDSPMSKQRTSPLETRNNSLLAHGRHPVTEKGYKALRQDLISIAEVHPEELPDPFPSLSIA